MLHGVGSLHIDLTAIQHNWSIIRQQVSAGVAVAAVVKANGYGLGAERVVNALIKKGCRSFFVASTDEAIEVRHLADESTIEIFILSGVTPACFTVCAEQNFIPVLYSPELISAWSAFNFSRNKNYPCVIKIDTGMHRLGVTQPQFSRLLSQPQMLLQASPMMLMSHLACADTPEHPLNILQLECFEKNAADIKRIIPSLKLCLANSSGVYLGKQYHFDMVRPGYALYGGNPQPHLPNPMSAVVSLELPVAQFKHLRGPASVGYGATYNIAQGETRTIAIALGGYADGIIRHLSNKGYGVLAGQQVPIVGRVSMDSVMFDVSGINNAEQYDSITLIGLGNLLDSVAASAGTIGYEILTQLGARYRRHYNSDGK